MTGRMSREVSERAAEGHLQLIVENLPNTVREQSGDAAREQDRLGVWAYAQGAVGSLVALGFITTWQKREFLSAIGSALGGTAAEPTPAQAKLLGLVEEAMARVVVANPYSDPPWSEITSAHVSGVIEGASLRVYTEIVLHGRRHLLDWVADPGWFDDMGPEGVSSILLTNWWEQVLTSPEFRA
jgi:hypothetical protein